MTYNPGRHFLQIPGPTNVPDRILRAMDRPTIDHRGPAFSTMTEEVLNGVRRVFKTRGEVVIFPSSGTGAWEAALVNTLSPGDAVVMYETGHFATMWCEMARKLGLDVRFLDGDWRSGVDAERIGEELRRDDARRIKAVAVVHNETSTGVASSIPNVRAAIDAVGHPALLMVDTISSLASIDYRHEEWGVDVTVAGSQKGLMLPPGLGFNAISERALRASENAGLPRVYWDWHAMLGPNRAGFFPYTPATNLLYGLAESIRIILDEAGLAEVFHRHDRHADATRRAVEAWGLEVLCRNRHEYSSSLTAVCMPSGHSADEFRGVVLERFNLSLGNGLGRLNDQVFRIGHLGDFNDLMLVGTLGGIEMGLGLAGIPSSRGGIGAALDRLANDPEADSRPRPTARARANA